MWNLVELWWPSKAGVDILVLGDGVGAQGCWGHSLHKGGSWHIHELLFCTQHQARSHCHLVEEN